MLRRRKHIKSYCFLRLIPQLLHISQISCQCLWVAGNINYFFRSHLCNGIHELFGTSASWGIHDDYIGFFTSLCHIDQETTGIIAEETDIGYLVHFGVVDGIPDCILV